MKNLLFLGSIFVLIHSASPARAAIPSADEVTPDDEIPAQARADLRELLSREVDRKPAIDGPPIYADDPRVSGMLNLDYSEDSGDETPSSSN